VGRELAQESPLGRKCGAIRPSLVADRRWVVRDPSAQGAETRQ